VVNYFISIIPVGDFYVI